MPERPDLDYQVPLLRAALVGRRVTAARLDDPIVLRNLLAGDPRRLLPGRALRAVERRSAFVVLTLGPATEPAAEPAVEPDAAPEAEPELWLAIHCMLAGRFTITQAGAKVTKDTAFTLDLDDGRSLRFRDDREMGKVYLLRPADAQRAPGLLARGHDVLNPSFTPALLAGLVKKRRDQLKVFLMDKDALDSMGNAYADEVMWAAGLHPKTRMNTLDAAAIDRLHTAIVSTLTAARTELELRRPALDEKVRDFLSVRNRKGEPCPRCGAPVRVAGVLGHDAFFCATCQPDPEGVGLVRWAGLRRGGG